MYRYLLTILVSLVLTAALTATGAMAAPETEGSPAELAARTQSLYEVLLRKNVRHYRVREDLAPFFRNQEDLSNFIIRLARELKDEGVGGNPIEAFEVGNIEVVEATGYGETETKLTVDWLLFFNRSLERHDRWQLVDGRWYVDPPPLKNLDYP